jgi:photosystem II stability/assembly factor-like uncharacterized protein
MKPQCLLVVVVALASFASGQTKSGVAAPFTISWTEGKCIGCKTAFELGRIQFISRREAWAVGYSYPPPGAEGSGDFIVVHTSDAGRTWREVPQTHEHAGDPDGPPAFSFLDAARGWIAWWNPADDPKMIRTGDGGQHWQDVSQQPLGTLRFIDDNREYGTSGNKFLRTLDGGHNWMETDIPHLRSIDRMFFLAPELGWIAGTDGKDFSVFRTSNGGREWEESRTTPPKELAEVRDVFFLSGNRGWLITLHLNDSGTYLFSTVDGGKNWMPEPDLSFQGKGKWAGIVRFVSEKKGFIFESAEVSRHSLIHTADGGAHWNKQTLPRSVHDCQVFEGDLLCSSGDWPSGFQILTLHPK